MFFQWHELPQLCRTIGEIQEWLDATEGRKEEIIEECVKRLDPFAYDYWKELYDHKKRRTIAQPALVSLLKKHHESQ